MIAVDANLLVYAYVSSYRQHDRARTWLEAQLATSGRVGLPWASLLAFVRLVTNARLLPQPASTESAWGQVEQWFDAESTWVPLPAAGHRVLLGQCLRAPGLRANDVPDADLAALAIENGLRLATSDGGFARYPRLEWVRPAQLTRVRASRAGRTARNPGLSPAPRAGRPVRRPRA